jgi:hypothetical protein
MDSAIDVGRYWASYGPFDCRDQTGPIYLDKYVTSSRVIFVEAASESALVADNPQSDLTTKALYRCRS